MGCTYHLRRWRVRQTSASTCTLRRRARRRARPSFDALDDVDAEVALDDADLADLEAQREVLERIDELRVGGDVVARPGLRRAGILGQIGHELLDLGALLQLRDGVLDQL